MSMRLADLTRQLAQCLTQNGVSAVDAWAPTACGKLSGAMAAVSLRGCTATPGGFAQYLGERYNQETQQWEELYGLQAKLTLGLDLYAPAGAEQALQRAAQQTMEILAGQGVCGLSLEELVWEETSYDSTQRVLRRGGSAVCRARLYGAAQEGEEFVDFEIRGGFSP